MLVPDTEQKQPLVAPAAPAPAPPDPFGDRVQNELNLHLPLKSPAQAPALGAAIKANQKKVNEALSELHYVHFARFLVSPDYTTLWVITTYDGGLHAYIMDFVAVMGDVFTDLLQFVKDAPRLPVQKYPRDFVEFIDKHHVKSGLWSAYPDLTVIDIQQAARKAGL